MTSKTMERNARPEAEPQAEQPDFKWAVEWLVQQQGQRRAAEILGVNRKTVALALRRERLTGRMSHAVQTLLANLDDPVAQEVMPLERMESQIRFLLKSMDEIDQAWSKGWPCGCRRWRRRRCRHRGRQGTTAKVWSTQIRTQRASGSMTTPLRSRNRSGGRTDGGLAGGGAGRSSRSGVCVGKPPTGLGGTASRAGPPFCTENLAMDRSQREEEPNGIGKTDH